MAQTSLNNQNLGTPWVSTPVSNDQRRLTAGCSQGQHAGTSILGLVASKGAGGGGGGGEDGTIQVEELHGLIRHRQQLPASKRLEN